MQAIEDRDEIRELTARHCHSIAKAEAAGLCSVEIRLVQAGEAYTAAGWYNDRYRREADRWRFTHRLFHVFHWVPLSKGWV